MVMRIVIEAFGEKQMSRVILRLGSRAADPLPAFDAIRKNFYEYEKKLFDTEGVSGGQAWAPLAASTVQAKARLGLDSHILQATRTLRNSLTRPNAKGSTRTVTPSSLFVGSNVPYGVYHQSTAPRHKLPRRPPVLLTDEVRVEWIKILQRWLVSGVVE